MEINYKSSVSKMLTKMGLQFAGYGTLSETQIFKLLQMLELQIQVMEDEAVCDKSKNEHYKRLYEVLSS